MTAPTEAEIRAYMETALADWTIDTGRVLDDLDESGAFERFIANDHVTDDDFGVYVSAHNGEVRDLVPAMTAALRPFIIEAQVRGAVRFFEHYPNAPLAKREPVTA
jgi:hypothetical protein